MLKIILMGTGPFAVPSFDWLRQRAEIAVEAVITRPVVASEQRSKGATTPVRDWAESYHLPIQAPESINAPESIERLRSYAADLLVVCDYGQILSADAIATAKLGGINLHGSLLPRHRGAAPVQWSILTGDLQTGATVIHLTPKLDAGPILARFETSIKPGETAYELEERLSRGGVQAVSDAIEKILRSTSMDDLAEMGEPQPANLATKAPRLNKSDGQLDFRYPATLIECQVRGLQPWPGAFGQLQVGSDKELRVSLGAVRAMPEPVDRKDLRLGQLLWGSALATRAVCQSDSTQGSPELAAVCVDGLLAISTLQPAGKRLMTAKEFLAGYGRSGMMAFRIPTANTHPLLEKLSKRREM